MNGLNDAVIEILKFLSLFIIMSITIVVSLVFIGSHGPVVALFATVVAFIATSIPMSIFLVLCSINDKLSKKD